MIGYGYFEAHGVVWRRLHGALVPLQMPHAVAVRGGMALRALLLCKRALFARWEEEFDRAEVSEWWHVIRDGPQNFDTLSGNTKSKIRRGSKRFEAIPVTRDEVLAEGYAVYRAAFARYETFEQILSDHAFAEAIGRLPAETEFWGVRERESGQLVAFSENLVRDDACFYATIWLQPDALKAYAGYLLIHEMNRHYLNDREFRYVSDGARSISHQTNIHRFLEDRFGFRRAYARLRVVYFPGLGAVIAMLYPFRAWFGGRSGTLPTKLAVVLEQERIRRSCQNRGDGA